MGRRAKRFTFLVIGFLTLGFLEQAEISGDERITLSQLLPKRVEGWSVYEKDKIYNRNTLFRYMNGAAEVYLAFDFRGLQVREYIRESSPSIVAEIYQMSSSEDAYGIFSHDTDGQSVEIGRGAVYSMGLLRFWKGRTFVRLIAERETEEAKAAILDLGKTIASSIPMEGKDPKLLSLLPDEGLVNEIIPYFHKKLSLDLHYYLADSNLLNLSESTNAVLARFQSNGQRVRLLLCMYQNKGEAKEAFEKFCKAYFSGSFAGRSTFRMEKVERGEYVSARWAGRLIILIFEAKNETTCKQLTQSVESRMKEYANDKRKE